MEPIVVKEVSESLWTPELLTALFSGMAVIITTLGGLLVQLRTTQKTVVKTEAEHNAKLDNITSLVDGRYSQVLKELAGVKALVAERSGLLAEQEEATKAQRLSDEQEGRVEMARRLDQRGNKGEG